MSWGPQAHTGIEDFLPAAHNGYGLSIGYLRVLFDYMSEQGVPPDRICIPSRLNEIRSATANSQCKVNEWHALMRAAESVLGDPHLSLTLAGHIKPWHSGLVGFLAMTSSTVQDVGRVLSRYHHFLNDLEAVDAGMHGERFVLGIRPLTAQPCPRLSLLTLGSWAWHARWLTGRDDMVFDADFEFAPPSNLAAFQKAFGGTLRFNQARSALYGAAQYLDYHVLQQEPNINRMLHEQAKQQLDQAAERAGSFLARLERLIAARMADGEITLVQLAAQLDISPRTLQSRLEELNLSFRAVVERVRKGWALRYLDDAKLPVMQIALMLGFANQTSFHHAFKRWTGSTPGEFRKHAPRG